MNHPAVKVAVIVIAGLFFIMIMFFRFEIQTLNGSPIVYKLNRMTGDVCAQWPSGEVQCQRRTTTAATPPVTQPENKPDECKPYPPGTAGNLMNQRDCN